MNAPTIITAVVVTLRGMNARVCADCGRPITVRALRVAEKHDGRVDVLYYHPEIDEDDEIRGCAPEHPLVRTAIRRRVRA